MPDFVKCVIINESRVSFRIYGIDFSERTPYMNKKQWIFLILALGATFFIFSNSMQIAAESSRQSGRLVAVVSAAAQWLGFHADTGLLTVVIRKGAHITEFFLQSLFIGMIFVLGRRPFRERMIYVLFFGLLTGCADEFIQKFSPGRGSLVSDVFVDFTGVLLAALVCLAVSLRREKRKNRR